MLKEENRCETNWQNPKALTRSYFISGNYKPFISADTKSSGKTIDYIGALPYNTKNVSELKII